MSPLTLVAEALADGDAHLEDVAVALLPPMREQWQLDTATGELSLRHQIVYPRGTL